MELNSIAIVIPAKDEEKVIVSIVEKLSKDFNVIVIDDGSSDKTSVVAKQAGAFVYSNNKSSGYDEALSTGFKVAKESGFDAVITMDADGEHSPQVVYDISYYLRKGIPLVIGKRKSYGRITEAIFGYFCMNFYGFWDPFCGMKGYSMALYDSNGGFSRSKSIGIELCLNSIRNGNRFVEVPVYGRKRVGKSRFGSFISSNIKIASAIIRYYRNGT